MCINCAHMHMDLFLDLGGLDRLDIAYDGSPKCFSTCGSSYRSCIINSVCIICINCAKKGKNNFFVIFLSFVALIDSVSHMMTFQNISQHLAVVIGHAHLNRHA